MKRIPLQTSRLFDFLLFSSHHSLLHSLSQHSTTHLFNTSLLRSSALIATSHSHKPLNRISVNHFSNSSDDSSDCPTSIDSTTSTSTSSISTDENVDVDSTDQRSNDTTTQQPLQYEETEPDLDSEDEDELTSYPFLRRQNLSPSTLVGLLDKSIIGQSEAKRRVSVALRNRYRRHELAEEVRDEITPKNLLMVGPTGSGKTEIARRLAKITKSPFIKVEATKYTETGFYGKDVDTIIKDLVRVTMQNMKSMHLAEHRQRAAEQVEYVLLDALVGSQTQCYREEFKQQLRDGKLEGRQVTVLISMAVLHSNGVSIADLPKDAFLRSKTFSMNNDLIEQTLPVCKARPLLLETYMSRVSALTDKDLPKMAIRSVENDGIVVIDEIDKIASDRRRRDGADASSDGVQRDLLPLIEGCVISTQWGNVKTDHILFIAAGAFSAVQVSDLLPELQGRLPIRVELKALTEDELYRVLTETENSLIQQQVELMATEKILLEFADNAIREIARVAAHVNKTQENIGARRLNTVIQAVVDEISFKAPDLAEGTKFIIDKQYVISKTQPLLQAQDLQKYIL